MPQKAPRHHLQRPHLQRRGAKQNSASHWDPRIHLDHCKATQTEMVWARNKIFRVCQDNPAGHSTRKEKQTEKEDNIPEWTGMMLGTAMMKAERNGGSWLPGHLWRPNGPPDYGIGEGEVSSEAT